MKKLTAIFIFTCFCCNLFAQNIPSYVPTNGLVGWWPFNGNANDESGNGNNGTVNGATLTTDRFGNVGNAFSFDGVNDFIETPNSNSLTFNQNSISISVWVNVNQWPQTNSMEDYIISKHSFIGSNQVGFHCYLYGGNNTSIEKAISFRYRDGISASWNPGLNYNSLNLNNGNWFNIIFVHDNNKDLAFFNGLLVDSTSSVSIGGINSAPLLFGCLSNYTNNYNGSLDDIAIYNRALTQEEVTSLYQGSSTNNVTNGSVGINTTTPHSSAALDITDTQRGLLIPRMTASQRNDISNPAEGLMVFQTDDSTGFWYYSGQKWNTINSKGIKGDQGLQGLQGVKGDSGISVSNTTVQGDSLYITLSNGQTINAGNVRGLKGAKGEQGVQGILPNGSSAGNTPYWNGTSWVTNSSNVYNNGTSVGINTSSPHSSAAIDISDTARGILIPRMTMKQRNAIQNPSEGLMVYQIDSVKGYRFFDGTEWTKITTEANQQNTITNSYSNTQVFLNPGDYTWTVPTGINSITIELWGGAGGGGALGCSTDAPTPNYGPGGNGGNGGKGGYNKVNLNVVQGQVFNLTVGSGGNGGRFCGVDGGNGGISTFSSYIAQSGTGGKGGYAGAYYSYAPNGIDGLISNFNYPYQTINRTYIPNGYVKFFPNSFSQGGSGAILNQSTNGTKGEDGLVIIFY